jgi:hypothetical protein
VLDRFLTYLLLSHSEPPPQEVHDEAEPGLGRPGDDSEGESEASLEGHLGAVCPAPAGEPGFDARAGSGDDPRR